MLNSFKLSNSLCDQPKWQFCARSFQIAKIRWHGLSSPSPGLFMWVISSLCKMPYRAFYMWWVALYPKVVCHPFKEQGIGKVLSVIFTFQCFLGVALEIKLNFTTQVVFFSYFRIAGFFHSHGTNMTKTRFTRHSTDVAQIFLPHCLSGGALVGKPDETNVWRKLYHVCSINWTPLKSYEKRCLVHIKHTELQVW